MSMIAPAPMRSVVSDVDGSLRIVIPSKKNWFAIIFLAIWLVGWTFAEFAVPSQIMRSRASGHAPDYFIFVWMIAWTIGGFFALGTWLWTLAGKEIVTLDGQYVRHRRDVFGIGKTDTYDAAQIRRLRVSAPVTAWGGRDSGMQFWGMSGGWLAFDYGAQTRHVGAGIDESEAGELLKAIGRRFPQLCA
ncbi:MAG: hypothetical protein WCG78_00055 [Candidatus Omnitrophota bacterium]